MYKRCQNWEPSINQDEYGRELDMGRAATGVEMARL